MKVVINAAPTSFNLSDKVLFKYAKHWGIPEYRLDVRRICRHCPYLIEIVEQLGAEANAEDTLIKITEVAGDRYKIIASKQGECVITPEDLENIRWVKAIGIDN